MESSIIYLLHKGLVCVETSTLPLKTLLNQNTKEILTNWGKFTNIPFQRGDISA